MAAAASAGLDARGSATRPILNIESGKRRGYGVMQRLEDLQRRDGRWVIIDIVGKGRRVRTVPVPPWAKALVDHCAAAPGLDSGRVCRRFREVDG